MQSANSNLLLGVPEDPGTVVKSDVFHCFGDWQGITGALMTQWW